MSYSLLQLDCMHLQAVSSMIFLPTFNTILGKYQETFAKNMSELIITILHIY